MSILVISKYNRFAVLFDKIAFVQYFIWETYLYFSVGNGQPGEPALCQLYRHTFVPNYTRQQLPRIEKEKNDARKKNKSKKQSDNADERILKTNLPVVLKKRSSLYTKFVPLPKTYI